MEQKSQDTFAKDMFIAPLNAVLEIGSASPGGFRSFDSTFATSATTVRGGAESLFRSAISIGDIL